MKGYMVERIIFLNCAFIDINSIHKYFLKPLVH
jgi:hypothetical protein